MPGSNATLTIHLDRIIANVDTINTQLAKHSSLAAVVKANAYGLGMEPIAKALFNKGLSEFFVAHLEEAILLRQILPQALIYILHGLTEEEAIICRVNHLIPVINHPGQGEIIRSDLRHHGTPIPYALHIDTGINRLGFTEGDAAMWLQDTTIPAPCLIMSHLASSSEPTNPSNSHQRTKLAESSKLRPEIRTSLANSSGIFLGEEYHTDQVRPGAALYGINPLPKGEPNPMLSVITLKSPILQLRTLAKDESIGYSGTARLKAGSKLATIPLGYADGYFFHLANKGFCYISGITVPVIGRVSMDLVTLDVSKVPDHVLASMPEVEVYGQHSDINLLSELAGTIPYELLTRLGNRYKKHYQG